MSTAESLQQDIESRPGTVMICPCCGGKGIVPNPAGHCFGDDPELECAVCGTTGRVMLSFGQDFINWRRCAPNAHLLGASGRCDVCDAYAWCHREPNGELLCSACYEERYNER